VQKVNNNGLMLNLPDIARLKIANTGDKHPQARISDYFAIFMRFLWT
jgi:hypothetical protein